MSLYFILCIFHAGIYPMIYLTIYPTIYSTSIKHTTVLNASIALFLSPSIAPNQTVGWGFIPHPTNWWPRRDAKEADVIRRSPTWFEGGRRDTKEPDVILEEPDLMWGGARCHKEETDMIRSPAWCPEETNVISKRRRHPKDTGEGAKPDWRAPYYSEHWSLLVYEH